jgi:hypothetical protein
MIHVVTVHWQSAKWIDPQLRYLEANIDEPFRVYAALEGIAPEQWERFHYAADLQGTHPQKLNALAAVVLERAAPDDLLVFLDGDALPVRPIATWMSRALDHRPLVAVRRDENLGDRQPHPCFAFTTCGFWREIRGDWGKGGTWTNSLGDTVTDVGGNLLHLLEDRAVDWLPLLRTNTVDRHPLWFAVYDHRIYHHGAGFRARQSRVGVHSAGEAPAPKPTSPTLEGLAAKVVRRPSLVTSLRPHHVSALPEAARMSVVKQRRRRSLKRLQQRFEGEDPYEQALFERLSSDPDFYREFDSTPDDQVPAE